MRPTLWNSSSRAQLITRINRLEPDSVPRWGQMTAPQMLAHLNDWVGMAIGDIPTRRRVSVLRRTPVKELAIYVLPFPKGVPTAQELVTRQPAEWDVERSVLCRQIESFGSLERNRAWPEHPAFGHISADAWGVLGYRHTDHHLRQFGV